MKKVIIGIICIVFAISKTMASHVFGGEITWKAVRDNNAPNFQRDGYGFIFIMTLYRDCSGIPMNGLNPSMMVQGNPVDKFGSVVNSISLSPAPGRLGTGYEITPICNGTTSIVRCGAGNPLSGGGGVASRGAIAAVQFWSDTVWLTGVPPGSGWFFQSSAGAIPCCRNANDNTGCTGDMILRARMLPYFQSTSNGPTVGIPVQRLGDDSPEFLEFPNSNMVQTSGTADTTLLLLGAVDRDLDKMVYSIDNPFSAINTPCSYNRGYSINNPMPNMVPAYGGANQPIDSLSGIIRMLPNTQGNFLICIKVSTYKNGQKVAENFRDFQTVIITNSPGLGYVSGQSAPRIFGKNLLSGNGLISGENMVRFFGDEIQLEVRASDFAPATDSVTVRFTSNSFLGTYQTGLDTFRVDSGCFAPPCASIRSILPNSTSVIPKISLNGMEVGYGVKARNNVAFQIKWKTSCAQSIQKDSSFLGQVFPQYYPLNFVANDNQCPFNGKNTFSLNLVLKEVSIPKPTIDNLTFLPSQIQMTLSNLVDISSQEAFDTSLQQSVFRRVNRFHGLQIYRDSCGAGMSPLVTLWKPAGLTDSAQLSWIQQLGWVDRSLSRDTCQYTYVVRSVYGCDSLGSIPSDPKSILVLNGKDLSKVENESVKLYPNPASNKVYFSFARMLPTEIRVYGISGNSLFQKDFGVVQQGEFSVEGWPYGTFFAEFWVKRNGQKVKTSVIKFTVLQD